MRILTTGLAGQQQPRSARRGGPDQPDWSSAARPAVLALRRGNLILIQLASGYGKPPYQGLSTSPCGDFRPLSNPRRPPAPPPISAAHPLARSRLTWP